ncbi:MAG: MutT/Nudix, partial [Candidatus Moranbacteria bacterium GW2011_GWD2_36_198]
MRIVVRAIIKNDDSLLVIKRIKNGETYFVFPGGGVDDGESHPIA